MVGALRLGGVSQSVPALSQVIEKSRIFRLQGQRRLEALPRRQVVAALKEINAILVVVA